jgi:(p)ppGpp synthase/HD superfamily hydrolase
MSIDPLDPRVRLTIRAHSGQRDKAGQSYFSSHLIPVANMVPEHLQYAALAHDILEDTDTTINDLRDAGFTLTERYLIETLTKTEGMSRTRYLERIVSSKGATTIKIADVMNNVMRLHLLSESEHARLTKKYQRTLEFLAGIRYYEGENG